MSELVRVERHGSTCIVRLQREQKLNAISAELERQLCAALERPELQAAACVIVAGGARAFSAGADLGELHGRTPAQVADYYRATGDFTERVAELPQPTFSAISGWCLGAGLELALATDFRIAEQSAIFGLPEVGIGIVPSSGGTHRLVRLLGVARAKELILLRERVTAAEAHRLGLVTEVVGDGDAVTAALAHCERLAALPRLAVQLAGQVIDAAAEASRLAALELERLAYMALSQASPADSAAADVTSGVER